jgi:hypothetical protein
VKENSIERDIHLLESYAGMTHKMNDNQGRPKLDQAIERILSDYKRVLKENNRLEEQVEYDKTHIYTPQTIELNFISKSKVQDKIEELKKKVEELTDEKGYWGGSDLLEQIKVLQELLESEERK